jgi:hypothetical protein
MASCRCIVLAASLIMVAAPGCSAGVHAVDRDLASLRDHLEQGRYQEAWKGLSAEQRDAAAAEAFARTLEQDPAAVEKLIAQIDQMLADPEITYSALVTLEDGTDVVLVLAKDGWVLQSPVTTFYGQSTPREALASFIKAFKAGRWDVLADLVPSKYSTQEDAVVLEKAWGDPAGREVMERLLKVIEDHIDDEFDVKGNQAVLRYPEGQVTFMREGGRWVILDLD